MKAAKTDSVIGRDLGVQVTTSGAGVVPAVADSTRAMRSRRSVRYFFDRPVPKEATARILASARWAPSAHNRQPWRIAIIESAERKASLASAMGERLVRDRRASGDEPIDIERDVARSRERLTQSPLLVLVCMTLEDMDRYGDGHRSQAERTMAIQSVAAFTQNLLLAATSEGLGACWMCAPLFCPDVVAATCNLPHHWEPQALISIGYPRKAGKDRLRLDLSEFVLQWTP